MSFNWNEFPWTKFHKLDIRWLKWAIGQLKNSMESLGGQVGEQEENIYALQSDMDSVQESIATLDGKCTQVQTNITEIQGDVTQAQTDIDGIEGDVTQAQADVTALQGRVAALESQSPGSVVSITPRLQSGTKIADYSVDGVAGELYAPNNGGGGGNGYSSTVLWTRSGSEYDAQSSFSVTLSESLADYKGLVFEFIPSGSYSNNYTYSPLFLMVRRVTYDDHYIIISKDDQDSNCYMREVTIDYTNNILYFSRCQPLTGGTSEDSNHCLVYRIYGIKF